MKCPYCQNFNTSVIDTTKDKHGGIRERRRCDACNQRFSMNVLSNSLFS